MTASATGWAILEAVANAATAFFTLGGFAFVSRQIFLLKRSLRSDTNGRLCEQSLTIMAFIADRPHLYDYFYEGKTLSKNDEHRVEVLCAAEMMANYMDLVLGNLADVDEKVQDRWKNFVSDAASKSPVLTNFILDRRSWYSGTLISLISAEHARPSESRIWKNVPSTLGDQRGRQ